MASLTNLFSRALGASACAVRLYAALEKGNVTSLCLAANDDGAAAAYSLNITATTPECANNPSALTLDQENRVLYCHDRGSSKDTAGSLNSFSISDADGSLTRISRVASPLSAVWGEIVTADDGDRLYISASYTPSAISAFPLLTNGTLPPSGPAQTIFPTSTTIGAIADRQDASHSHHVILDPTGAYVLVPDLGADRVRVFAYAPDNATAPLTELAPLLTRAAGVGPRHGFFRVNAAGDTFFFFNGELDQQVHAYKVAYAAAGLAFEFVFEAPALGPESSMPSNTAPASECLLSPDGKFLVVSNREVSFASSSLYQSSATDSISTWAINEDGTLEFVQNAPSGGYQPRQLSINKAGDMLAVGHQVNKTVVIWKRDVATGKIVLEEEGGKLAQAVLSGPVITTVWDE